MKKVRLAHGRKQKDVADLLGISRRTYSDYERGILRIPVEYLIVLARYYDVSMDYLTGITNIRREYPVM
ncbi:MAG: helix-turn-helix transcriptional regulator [Lachnospiraceae bacterium]|nr:helix-turn-helix transcriptional regulator [Lachnospiraceae bacterium]